MQGHRQVTIDAIHLVLSHLKARLHSNFIPLTLHFRLKARTLNHAHLSITFTGSKGVEDHFGYAMFKLSVRGAQRSLCCHMQAFDTVDAARSMQARTYLDPVNGKLRMAILVAQHQDSHSQFTIDWVEISTSLHGPNSKLVLISTQSMVN